jgi:hypothetical protein
MTSWGQSGIVFAEDHTASSTPALLAILSVFLLLATA